MLNMPTPPNKQNIFNELKALVAGIGVWAIVLLVVTLLTALIFGVTPNKIGILSTIIGLVGGIYVAYIINGHRIPKLTFGVLVISGAVFYGLTYLISRSMIYGIGMEPSYRNTEGVWVDRFTVELSKPKRGEVVLVKGGSSGAESIKRIIGLPGEEVKLLGGMVIINGDSALVEPYVKVKVAEECAIGSSFTSPYAYSFKLEPYEYLVLQDNREESPQPIVISETDIVGRVLNQRGQPTLTKLSPSGLKEYSNINLGVSFQYSSGCMVEEKDKELKVKDSRSDSPLLGITLFGKNPKELTTEDWIKNNYKVLGGIFCEAEENCRVKPGDRLFQITERFSLGDLQYVSGSFKDAKYLGNDLATGYGLFVAVKDRVYLIGPGDKNTLEAIKFK